MIHRTEHNDNFTVIANETIRNPDLSDSAKVLLFFMLSCSDDWIFSVKGLASALGWSERKIMRLVPELKKAGYLEQKLHSDSKGHFLPPEWVVIEKPSAIRNSCISVEPQYTKTAKRSDRKAVEPQCGKSVVIRNNNIKEITNRKKEQKKETHHILGRFQNVFLTDSEQKELCEHFGYEDVCDYIDRLSRYLNQHPDKEYKNHKSIIEKWIVEDKERKAI